MNNKPFNINHRLPFDCKKVIAKIKDKKTCSNDLPIMKKKED